MSNFEDLSAPLPDRRSQLDIKKVEWQAAVLLLISLIASLVYLRIGLSRVFYSFALDLVEEDMLMQAWRIAQNQTVFVPPNADFVPQVYMPLFTWLGGQFLKVTGFAFWPLRLISFLATMGTAVLIFYIGWRESGSKTAAFAGSALFLAGYKLVGGWYDLARVDALFTFFSLAGLVVLVYGGKGAVSRTVLGVVLLSLAFLTKQNGLLVALVAGFYIFTTESAEDEEGRENSAYSALVRVLMIFALTFLVVAGLPIWVLQMGSGGWFSYYVVDIAYASPLDFGRLRNIFLWELGAGTGVLVGLWLVTAVAQLSQLRWQWSWLKSFIANNPWLLFGGTAVFISVAGRSTVGGNLNNLVIGYALLCLAPALSWGFQRRGAEAQRRNVLHWGWFAAVGVQFGLALFPLNQALPQTYLPTAEMEQAGALLLAQVEATEGEVWLLMHPTYSVLASKRPYVHLQSLWHARRRGTEPLPADLVALIENQHFAQIISDESDFFEREPAFLQLLLAHYEAERVLGDGESPRTLSGPIIRPLTVYVPRR